MYDLEYKTEYQQFIKFDNDQIRTMYQNDLMIVFQESSYNDVIMRKIGDLFEKVKDIPEMVELLTTAMKNLEDSIPLSLMQTCGELDLEYGFIALFSFEYFHHFHPIMQKILKKEDCAQEISTLNKILKNNKLCI